MTLDQWLERLQQLHPAEMELGLDRVARVWRALGAPPVATKVVTVAGTNGKGSCVEVLRRCLESLGHRVGAYTSPHLLRFNERIRIDGVPADDERICAAFERIEAVRQQVPLTFFEYTTLAALDLFARAALDYGLLEVGLGGRLDAVNIIAPDLAIVTRIALDHEQWLGEEREAIALEKVAICRPGRPLLCADPAPPRALMTGAAAIGARPLRRLGKHFGFQRLDPESWNYWGAAGRLEALPDPGVPLPSAAVAIEAFAQLGAQPGAQLGESPSGIAAALAGVLLPGRYQRLCEPVEMVLDVAHNPDAVAYLAGRLAADGPGEIRALVGVMQDKNFHGMLEALGDLVTCYYPVALPFARAADPVKLCEQIRKHSKLCKGPYTGVELALKAALAEARPGERILIFGSFITVAEALKVLDCPETGCE